MYVLQSRELSSRSAWCWGNGWSESCVKEETDYPLGTSVVQRPLTMGNQHEHSRQADATQITLLHVIHYCVGLDPQPNGA